MAFSRSGGPGGQNVNKVETKVEVRWRPGTSVALGDADRRWLLHRLGTRLTADGSLVVTSNRGRTQAGNREDALAKLAGIVRSALTRPKGRRKTAPSRGATERRIAAKKQRARVKRDRAWREE